ncbi:MAG: hypothetical protein HY344_02255 [Candidatus Levybacteria bacterium]|nr:hypothetical protein [Candidatus Levybacteria bacterium]
MNGFVLVANPFWVNLLILIPFFLFYYFRKHKLDISRNTLLKTAMFGTAFGFIEAAVVVYLRAALGFLPGFKGTLPDIWRQASTFDYNQQLVINELPVSLFTVELVREAFTILMLLSVAFIAAYKFRERIAVFLWAFAFWDIFYYVFLYLTVRWPMSLTTPDLLFLIPVPWTSQVWFPILISTLTIFAVFINSKVKKNA